MLRQEDYKSVNMKRKYLKDVMNFEEKCLLTILTSAGSL